MFTFMFSIIFLNDYMSWVPTEFVRCYEFFSIFLLLIRHFCRFYFEIFKNYLIVILINNWCGFHIKSLIVYYWKLLLSNKAIFNKYSNYCDCNLYFIHWKSKKNALGWSILFNPMYNALVPLLFLLVIVGSLF